MPAPRLALLPLFALALAGCPHESDPDDPGLIGKYEAVDLKRTILGSRTLTITDAHHLKTDRGKVVRFDVSEEFFAIDQRGDDDLLYSTSTYGYGEGILFQHFDQASDPKRNIFYRTVP